MNLDDQTNQAIITIHAYFDSLQIEDLKKAAIFANIKFLQIFEEQSAAALCYGYKKNDSKKKGKKRDVLVYVFGGGILDVSYVEIEGSSFNILATSGDPNLGCQDFTNCIFEIISKEIENKCKDG